MGAAAAGPLAAAAPTPDPSRPSKPVSNSPNTPDQIHPQLVGAPREHDELHAMAQEAQQPVPACQETIVFNHRGVLGEWRRDDAVVAGAVEAVDFTWVGAREFPKPMPRARATPSLGFWGSSKPPSG